MTLPLPTGWTRRNVLLAAAAAALVAAAVVLPEAVARLLHAGGTGVTAAALPQMVSRGFDVWVATGSSELPPDLTSATAFWKTFHEAKAVLSIAALTALVVLQARTWTAYCAGTRVRRQRVMLALALLVETVANGLAGLVVLANVQGSIAPLSSVLSFLPAGQATPAMTTMHEQIVSGAGSPATTALLYDFRNYHLAVLVGSALLGLGLIFAGIVTGIRWAEAPARRLRDLVLAEVVLATGLGFLGLVLLANLSTVNETMPALALFLAGQAG
ncbi:MAG: hypothetical protein ACK5MT_17025 [Actinomycetales bacterium]